MSIKRSVGARAIGFSHLDNILDSLEDGVRNAAPDGGTILDVGCGEMYISSQLAARLGDEYQVVASDINPRKILEPKADAYEPQPNHIPIIGDATRLPFPENTFDVVYSTSFFSHVHSHDEALDEQIRVTKPGGRLLVIDENLFSPYQLYKWFLNLGPQWLVTQDRKKELEVAGFRYWGKNENHYSPRYWRRFVKSNDDLELIAVTTPRLEQDDLLQRAFALPGIDKLYMYYETHTVVVANVTPTE